MKKYKIGYTQGVYDMFHIGHLNLLNNAKQYCEYLVVGVNSDELVKSYKHKIPVISEEERRIIVSNIKVVDECIIVATLDKVEIHQTFHYDAVFIGDDWKGSTRWEQTREELTRYGVDVVFLPYTEGICSTQLKDIADEKVSG